MKLKRWQLFQKKSLGPNFACKRFHGISTNLPMFSITELKNPLLALLFIYCFICKTSFVLRHAKHCARILERKVNWDRRNHISEQICTSGSFWNLVPGHWQKPGYTHDVEMKSNLHDSGKISIFQESKHVKSSVVVICPFSYSCSFWSVYNVLPYRFLFTEDQVWVGVGYKMILLGAIALSWWRVQGLLPLQSMSFPPILKFSSAVISSTCLHSVSDLYTRVSCISDDSNYTLGNKSLIKCGNKLWKDIMHVKKMY